MFLLPPKMFSFNIGRSENQKKNSRETVFFLLLSFPFLWMSFFFRWTIFNDEYVQVHHQLIGSDKKKTSYDDNEKIKKFNFSSTDSSSTETFTEDDDGYWNYEKTQQQQQQVWINMNQAHRWTTWCKSCMHKINSKMKAIIVIISGFNVKTMNRMFVYVCVCAMWQWWPKWNFFFNFALTSTRK